jgi:hypothetical protein
MYQQKSRIIFSYTLKSASNLHLFSNVAQNHVIVQDLELRRPTLLNPKRRLCPSGQTYQYKTPVINVPDCPAGHSPPVYESPDGEQGKGIPVFLLI